MGFWAFVKARFSRKPSLSDPALAAVYGVPQGAAEQILNRVAAEFLDTKNAEARMIHNVIENYARNVAGCTKRNFSLARYSRKFGLP
jgi:hypothetical protein